MALCPSGVFFLLLCVYLVHVALWDSDGRNISFYNQNWCQSNSMEDNEDIFYRKVCWNKTWAEHCLSSKCPHYCCDRELKETFYMLVRKSNLMKILAPSNIFTHWNLTMHPQQMESSMIRNSLYSIQPYLDNNYRSVNLYNNFIL